MNQHFNNVMSVGFLGSAYQHAFMMFNDPNTMFIYKVLQTSMVLFLASNAYTFRVGMNEMNKNNSVSLVFSTFTLSMATFFGLTTYLIYSPNNTEYMTTVNDQELYDYVTKVYYFMISSTVHYHLGMEFVNNLRDMATRHVNNKRSTFKCTKVDDVAEKE